MKNNELKDYSEFICKIRGAVIDACIELEISMNAYLQSIFVIRKRRLMS